MCEQIVEECTSAVEPGCDDEVSGCEAPLEEHECNESGQRLEHDAENGCEDPFERYLDCVDEATCAWASRCQEERLDLDVCLGVD